MKAVFADLTLDATGEQTKKLVCRFRSLLTGMESARKRWRLDLLKIAHVPVRPVNIPSEGGGYAARGKASGGGQAGNIPLSGYFYRPSV
jgi:hypothetical protein